VPHSAKAPTRGGRYTAQQPPRTYVKLVVTASCRYLKFMFHRLRSNQN
jgi:hypothetical protein